MNRRYRALLAAIFLLLLAAACQSAGLPAPAIAPTSVAVVAPTLALTAAPTAVPTPAPTTVPTALPTLAPTAVPTRAPTAAPTVPLPQGAIDAAHFDAARAYVHVQALAGGIGSRVAGTEGARRGAEYVRSQFQSYGLAVEVQTFPVRSFEQKALRLAVTAPQARAMEADALIYSPSGQVTAALVAAPNQGRVQDYQGIDVKGKIVLVRRGDFLLSEKARFAASQGAAAVIIYNSEPQGFTGTLRDQVTIPAVAVSGDSGAMLLDMLRQGPVTISLDLQTEIAEREGRNVIARRPGSDRVLIFGGHMDSVPAGPGANDNASGTAVVLELARVLARSDRPETLLFIAFDAEEGGLIGSRHYVGSLGETDRRRVRAMFNFDMLGATDNDLLFIGSEDMQGLAQSSATRLGIAGRVGELNGGGSDHQSFLDVGIPAVFFYRDDPLFHTAQDTPDRVRPEHLAAAGRAALGMVAELR